jgi:hypothetical protein
MTLATDLVVQLAFAVHENKGVYALVLGSGLSRAAEIPTGWEITLDLIRRVAVARGIEEQPDWAAWYRKEAGKEPNYSTVLAELALSPAERRSILHGYIEPTEADREESRKVPTAAHRAIAELVRRGYIRVIITTNFDRLTENALREAGIEPTVIASADSLSGAEPITHSACYVLKLHGDYKDSRILNTDEELQGYPDEYNRLLDRIFDEYGLIVCGWSGEWDHALRAAFLRAPNRRYGLYWAARGKLRAPAEEIVDHRKARVLTISDADSFFTGLQQRIETLENTRRQNPLSVELVVNTVKRYLAKPEHRIQLDELVTQEADRMLAALDVPELAPHGNLSRQDFLTRIHIYEGATEPLARVAGVLGRWGDGTETTLVLDLIRALYAYAEKEKGGMNYWLGLRRYPAVLVFTSYGLGLTVARRWNALHALFSAGIARENREPKRIIESLFLWSWGEAANDALWNNVWSTPTEAVRRKTPLSDYLCSLFTEWGKSFAGLTPDYELLCERFELLASLAYLESTSEAHLEQAIASQNRDSFIWTPMGRVGWHSSNLSRLVQEIEEETAKRSLLEAGFAKGSTKFLQLSITNIQRIAGRMQWM